MTAFDALFGSSTVHLGDQFIQHPWIASNSDLVTPTSNSRDNGLEPIEARFIDNRATRPLRSNADSKMTTIDGEKENL